jgi:hypothetical protein
MDPVGGVAPLADAATAAGERAGGCRRRLDDLQGADGAITAADVLRAQERLVEAQARTAAAQQRRSQTQQLHAARELLRRFHVSHAGGTREPAQGPDGGTSTALRLKTFDWVRSGKVGLRPLWLSFIALGGESGLLELDAYLHGAWEMSGADRSVLEQVCWEYETFGNV